MDKNSGGRRVKACACRPAGAGGSRPSRLGGLLLIILLVVVFSLAAGCQKKEKGPAAPPATGPARGPAQTDEQKASETSGLFRAPDFHSTLTKDLNRPVPTASFSRNDRIYLVTVWTGLQGPHEIKVLWIRPDKTVQETVRLKENIPSKPPNYTTWAYLSFTKGLLNISPSEGKFIGGWKAQLYLDGNFLKEFDFTVF
jgi:MYXO-CTERM domain-containing protein